MKKKNNIITWDYDGSTDDHFDGSLNPHKSEAQNMIVRLIKRGYIVYIVTRRFGPDNSSRGIIDEHVKVLKTAKKLGIPENRIIFTDREWKYSTLKSIGSCMHIDDDEKEMYLIEKHLPDVKRVWLGNKYWVQEIIEKVNSDNLFSIWFQNQKIMYTFVCILMVGIISAFLYATFIN